jgi:hypothetical protein
MVLELWMDIRECSHPLPGQQWLLIAWMKCAVLGYSNCRLAEKCM